MIGKAATEQGCRLHIDCMARVFFEILLKVLIVFPNTAVGGIYSTGPVIAGMVRMAEETARCSIKAGSEGTSGGK